VLTNTVIRTVADRWLAVNESTTSEIHHTLQTSLGNFRQQRTWTQTTVCGRREEWSASSFRSLYLKLLNCWRIVRFRQIPAAYVITTCMRWYHHHHHHHHRHYMPLQCDHVFKTLLRIIIIVALCRAVRCRPRLSPSIICPAQLLIGLRSLHSAVDQASSLIFRLKYGTPCPSKNGLFSILFCSLLARSTANCQNTEYVQNERCIKIQHSLLICTLIISRTFAKNKYYKMDTCMISLQLHVTLSDKVARSKGRRTMQHYESRYTPWDCRVNHR